MLPRRRMHTDSLPLLNLVIRANTKRTTSFQLLLHEYEEFFIGLTRLKRCVLSPLGEVKPLATDHSRKTEYLNIRI